MGSGDEPTLGRADCVCDRAKKTPATPRLTATAMKTHTHRRRFVPAAGFAFTRGDSSEHPGWSIGSDIFTQLEFLLISHKTLEPAWQCPAGLAGTLEQLPRWGSSCPAAYGAGFPGAQGY